jgi:hypothetical protein
MIFYLVFFLGRCSYNAYILFHCHRVTSRSSIITVLVSSFWWWASFHDGVTMSLWWVFFFSFPCKYDIDRLFFIVNYLWIFCLIYLLSLLFFFYYHIINLTGLIRSSQINNLGLNFFFFFKSTMISLASLFLCRKKFGLTRDLAQATNLDLLELVFLGPSF